MLESYRSRVTATTSLRQGRLREEGSKGSQRQTCEPTDRNVIVDKMYADAIDGNFVGPVMFWDTCTTRN